MKGKFQLVLLFVVFFISGFSALVYQVAWQRILTIYYSVENISTTLIVSVYMLGLGLGAAIGGYLSERIRKRILLYFTIELLVGLFGFMSIPFLEFLGRHTAGSGYLSSFLLMFAFLCIPTLLMGITLPLLTKICNGLINNFMHSLSHLYFINTLGAAIGAVVTSYFFISFWGLDTSVYIAACINILIVIAVLSYSSSLATGETKKKQCISAVSAVKYFAENRIIYVIIFITGFIAIGYEIIWFRVIGILVKASAYSFSSVLFIYLLGLAMGSYYMKKYLTRSVKVNRKNLFASLQVAISVYVLLSVTIYYYLVSYVPSFTWLNSLSFNSLLHPAIGKPSFDTLANFLRWFIPAVDIIIWPLVFVFVPTLFMGASFPLMASMAYTPGKEGNTVGTLYFFNVLGNVSGGLVTGLVALKWLGSEQTLLIYSIIGASFIFLCKNKEYRIPAYRVTFFAATVVLGLIFFPKKTMLYSATHPKLYDKRVKKIIHEGVDGVVVSYSSDYYLVTYINGISHGGRPGQSFYHMALLAMSYKKELKKALVIGFGTGSMVEALLQQQTKPDITLVELSNTLITNLEQTNQLNSILKDEKVQLVYADGRKFLYNTTEKYDAVFIDPLHSTTSFSNNLYSKEFFTLVSDHLNDDGVFLVWSDETRITPKTVCAVFPFVNNYGLFSVVSKSRLKEDPEYKDELFNRLSHFRADMLKIDSSHSSHKSRETILAETLTYPINEDYKPHSEYYLGILD